ncbi:unnamed protein product [Acanthoscelides obtectus]|uniref:Uncharacterized protein n=1 Tax=Acanthoscelides obtectus TaxID=200917 RepID=A0A9P0QJ14_ACAOB|nr:unnamed protein product [Acanthoscelides obtectus]CAK1685256.1 hypothetical protein AOBTE_LOCUS35288 [Acanthoscelides obtectus]
MTLEIVFKLVQRSERRQLLADSTNQTMSARQTFKLPTVWEGKPVAVIRPFNRIHPEEENWDDPWPRTHMGTTPPHQPSESRTPMNTTPQHPPSGSRTPMTPHRLADMESGIRRRNWQWKRIGMMKQVLIRIS